MPFWTILSLLSIRALFAVSILLIWRAFRTGACSSSSCTLSDLCLFLTLKPFDGKGLVMDFLCSLSLSSGLCPIYCIAIAYKPMKSSFEVVLRSFLRFDCSAALTLGLNSAFCFIGLVAIAWACLCLCPELPSTA